MKKLSILFLAKILFISIVNGQTFGEVGSKWYYSEHADGMGPTDCEYMYYESVKDTLIENKTIHKIECKYFRTSGVIETLKPFYVYEENDTVFTWDSSNSRFRTTYIFSGAIGDTLTLDSPIADLDFTDTTYRLVIDTIVNVEIDGITLKKFYVKGIDDYQSYDEGEYMERIGGLNWFFPRMYIYPEAGGPIRCYSDNQIDSSFQSIACDYIYYTDVDEFNNQIQIFPNPTNDYITINVDVPVNKVEIFNVNGQLLFVTNQLTLNLKEFPIGEYFIKIELESGKVIEQKILKNACE